MMLEMIDYLQARKKDADKAIDHHVNDHAELRHIRDLLTTAPGCGRILAFTLITQMPELGQLDRRKITALAGLAPIAKDSGQTQGKRIIKGGRQQVRNALYMAATASLTHKNNPFKDRYQALTKRGKPNKLALTAVMRHILTTLNAMLRDNKPWTPTT